MSMEIQTVDPNIMPIFHDIIPGELALRGLVEAFTEKVEPNTDQDIESHGELPETGAEAFIEEELGYNEEFDGDMPDLPDDLCFKCTKMGESCDCEKA